MSTKQQIIDRIMRLEKELSDAESELSNSDSIDLNDILPGMVFCPPPGTGDKIVIVKVYEDTYMTCGIGNDPFIAWESGKVYTKCNLVAWIKQHHYERVSILTTNFNSILHSSEQPF